MRGGSASRVRAFMVRLFGRHPVQQPTATSGPSAPASAARRSRIAVAAGLCLVTAWLAFATVGLIATQRLLTEKERELARLERAHAELSERRDGKAAHGLRAELERARAAERETVAQFTGFRAEVRRQLAAVEEEFAALAEERDAAVELAESLRQSLDAARGWLRTAIAEKARLSDGLALAEARAAAVAEERDMARYDGTVVARRAELLEAELVQLREERRETVTRLRAWVGDQVEALEGLFASTGIDPERLIARAVEPAEGSHGEGGHAADEGGQGGPLRLALHRDVEIYTGAGALTPDADDTFGRMLMLQRLLAGLPLSAPLNHFRISSLFGERSDPFTAERAIHDGLDFIAVAGTEILATAPGRVLHAGPAGAYGNMVEIDHGLGVVTRYGHLKEVTVAPGDDVAFRQPIGIIGSTGRSTGRHLHYEVRIDGEAHDPAKFLDAGRHLIRVFEG